MELERGSISAYGKPTKHFEKGGKRRRGNGNKMEE
jgi:hypothetical protein